MRKLERITAPGIALACWLVLSAVATDGWAQAAGRPLKEQIESSFEVLPISGGLVLRPKQDMAGIRSLEVRDGELAIDGRDVERRDLELRVGREAAAPVLALLELDEEELEELFVLGPAIEATPSPDARDGDQVDEESDSAIPIPPMPPIPPGLPDAERERLERELERQHEEMRRRIEEAMDGRSEAIQRAQEEMERVQAAAAAATRGWSSARRCECPKARRAARSSPSVAASASTARCTVTRWRSVGMRASTVPSPARSFRWAAASTWGPTPVSSRTSSASAARWCASPAPRSVAR
jgi:hypothetical protein